MRNRSLRGNRLSRSDCVASIVPSCRLRTRMQAHRSQMRGLRRCVGEHQTSGLVPGWQAKTVARAPSAVKLRTMRSNCCSLMKVIQRQRNADSRNAMSLPALAAGTWLIAAITMAVRSGMNSCCMWIPAAGQAAVELMLRRSVAIHMCHRQRTWIPLMASDATRLAVAVPHSVKPGNWKSKGWLSHVVTVQ